MTLCLIILGTLAAAEVNVDDKATQLIKSMQSVRDFHANVGKLLQAATSAVAESGWIVPSRAAACGSTSSKAVYSPRYWIPEDAFQFYRKETDTSLLAFISVVFDDVQKPARIIQPFASAGWFQFAPGGLGAAGTYEYPWCRLSLFNDEELCVDGKWRDVEPKKIDMKGNYLLERARVLAYPLFSIQSESDLETHIIKPLLGDLPH
jgi:hypothetical protein